MFDLRTARKRIRKVGTVAPPKHAAACLFFSAKTN